MLCQVCAAWYTIASTPPLNTPACSISGFRASTRQRLCPRLADRSEGAEISFSFSHSFQAIPSSRKWSREGVVGVVHRFGRGSVGTIHG